MAISSCSLLPIQAFRFLLIESGFHCFVRWIWLCQLNCPHLSLQHHQNERVVEPPVAQGPVRKEGVPSAMLHALYTHTLHALMPHWCDSSLLISSL